MALTVWLRRVGAAEGAYQLPHQSKDVIRIMVWVDDLADLQRRKYGHLWLPVDHERWYPRLQLETDFPGPVLTAQVETTKERLAKVPEPPLRPYSLRVDLPLGAGNCFKLVEDSLPGFKHSFCLPPAYLDPLCPTLAPPERFTDAAPALWMAIGPVRRKGSPRTWTEQAKDVAQRLAHYVSYHVAMGASGLLLYSDELLRDYLRRMPLTAQLLQAGTLRFVHWEMREREHLDTDGRGRVLGYNYDQALVAGHAFLGLSACGTNLALLISDLDEYLYPAMPDNRWPRPYGTCMPARNASGGVIAMHTLSRIELLSSTVQPKDESALWGTAPGSGGGKQFQAGVSSSSSSSGGGGNSIANGDGRGGGGSSNNGGGGGVSSGASSHPLERYDRIYRQPMKSGHNKPITLPAAEIVAFFVHEGTPLQVHDTASIDIDCLVLLHVPNFFSARTTDIATYVTLDQSQFRPFNHWMFRGDSGLLKATAVQVQAQAPARVQEAAWARPRQLGVFDGRQRGPPRRVVFGLLAMGGVLLAVALLAHGAPRWLSLGPRTAHEA